MSMLLLLRVPLWLMNSPFHYRPYTLKLQLLINSSKAIVQQTDSLSQKTHRTSQALYSWAQDQSVSKEDEDLVDVGDRLAYLVFRTGDLFMEYGKMLEKARVELKEVRNFEVSQIDLFFDHLFRLQTKKKSRGGAKTMKTDQLGWS